MSKVFVTGASGFIGSHVCRQLNDLGLRPRVLVRPTSSRANLNTLDVEIVEGDLADPITTLHAMDGCTDVIHVAGYVSSQPSKARALMQSNADSTAHVLWAACIHQVRRIVYLGSVTALGAPKEARPWCAEDPYDLDETPVPYFQAKKAAEQIVQGWRDKGLPITSVYPAFCLGPGDIYLSSSRLVTEFVKGNIPFTTAGGMGFLDVRDTAQAILAAWYVGRVGERYFLAGHNMTYQDFFERLGEVTGKPAPRYHVPRGLLKVLCQIGEPLTDGSLMSNALYMCLSRYWWFDDSLARRELGWTNRPLEETLADSIAWLASQGHL